MESAVEVALNETGPGPDLGTLDNESETEHTQWTRNHVGRAHSMMQAAFEMRPTCVFQP